MQGSSKLNAAAEFVNEAYKALTDLGLRNKMIALPQGTRGRSIDFEIDPDTLYDLLLCPDSNLQIGSAPLLLAPESQRTELDLRRAVTSHRADAEAIASEQGIETKRLAIGTIAWSDVDGSIRNAPLFTIPVTITKDCMIAAAGSIEPNEIFPLLAASFGIEVAIDPTSPPSKALAVTVRQTERVKASKIAVLGYNPRVNLNLYAGKSAAMHRALDLSLRPHLSEVGALRLLAGESSRRATRHPETPNLHIVSADLSQDEAISAARAGQSFVLQGPPGTGKSQTIVNIVANLLNDGKRVLVSAEKAAALEVIATRWPERTRELLAPVLLRESGPALAVDAVFAIATPAVAALKIPNGFVFDTVIIDEASQIRLSHAAIVAALATQVIVIGDSQQMAPNNLFDRGGQSQQNAGMVRSLLDHVIHLGLPSVMLKQHYRSQHESLILFSNKRFYNSELDIIPSPVRDGSLGAFFRFVPDAVYDRAGNTDNLVEAKHLISEVIALAKDNRSRRNNPDLSPPPRSVGIITMNQSQRNLILTLLPDALASEGLSEIDCAASTESEMLFVKTLENVQGDERDVILVSATYGRDNKGRFIANLGPLSQPGAAKRVNVLATRARSKTFVYHSFDLDLLADSDSDGAQAFRDYWRYVRRTSVIPPVTEPNPDVDPADEHDIAFRAMQRWLRGESVSVHKFPQFIAGFRRSDLKQSGVKHYDVCFYFTGLRHPLQEAADLARIEKIGWTLCKVPVERWRKQIQNLRASFHLPQDRWSDETKQFLHDVYGAISIPFLSKLKFCDLQ
ncbi:DEAD/DEAH box helicase [Microvirga arabica]|uniref:DEAD/DEAH box helicase n=1 Tax=Microvirga arabica TaxID=1128671 RepID=UPI001939DEB3|nr:AAA domain-containing protein [Microvirga arabica]MBM1175218.1 AAA family ATPase [Microvirga arabica]